MVPFGCGDWEVVADARMIENEDVTEARRMSVTKGEWGNIKFVEEVAADDPPDISETQPAKVDIRPRATPDPAWSTPIYVTKAQYEEDQRGYKGDSLPIIGVDESDDLGGEPVQDGILKHYLELVFWARALAGLPPRNFMAGYNVPSPPPTKSE